MPTYYAPGTRKGNKTWIVRGSVNGRQRECVTPSDSKRSAQSYWEDWAAEIRRRERDTDRSRETATFDWAVDEFIASRETIGARYHEDLLVLRTHFAGWALRDMTEADIHIAAHQLRPQQKPQTKNRHVVTPAAAVLHFAARSKRVCEYFPVGLLEEVDPIRPITYPEELEPLVKVATGELRVLLSTLQLQGWRITETLMVQRDKIDWKRAQVFRWVSKSREWRLTAVDEEVLEMWRALPENRDGRLFTFHDRHAVYRRVDNLAAEHGIKIHYRPHQSRRGTATSLADADFDPARIAKILQMSVQTVGAYIKDNPERSRPAFAVIRGRTRGKNAKSA